MRGTGQLVLGSRPNCGGALGCGRARLAFAAIRQRLGVSKPRCKLDAVAKQSAGIPSSTFDILEKDLLYIQDRTGLDLLTPLAPVRDVHDKLVAALNPIAGSQMEEELEEQITQLQAEVSRAKQEAEASQQRLESTLATVSALEATAQALDRGASSVAGSSTQQAPYRSEQAGGPAVAAAAASASTSAPAVAGPARDAGPLRTRHHNRKIRSELAIPEQLREFWFPALFSSHLKAEQMKPLRLFDEDWVLFRDSAGKACCLRGTLADGQVSCAYHGWRFAGNGACTHIPSTTASEALLADARVQALPVQEAGGFIWVWPGRQPPAEFVPDIGAVPSGFEMHAELTMEVPVEHGLLLENLLDLAHAPFTHTSTFARNWPIPEAVRFHDKARLEGYWDPYPIDMAFKGPCMVISTIGVANVGHIQNGKRAEACKKHIHQLHVCLPAGPRSTRLLYRMSMDFASWTKFVPGIRLFWRFIAGQVLGEDLVLVVGQQDRMERGADVWAHPVSYDKLAIQYRRWRNSLSGGDVQQRKAIERDMAMSAGEIFRVDDADNSGLSP